MAKKSSLDLFVVHLVVESQKMFEINKQQKYLTEQMRDQVREREREGKIARCFTFARGDRQDDGRKNFFVAKRKEKKLRPSFSGGKCIVLDDANRRTTRKKIS